MEIEMTKEAKHSRGKLLNESTNYADRMTHMDILCKTPKVLKQLLIENPRIIERLIQDTIPLIVYTTNYTLQTAHKILNVLEYSLLCNNSVFTVPQFQAFLFDCLCVETESSLRLRALRIVLQSLNLYNSYDSSQVLMIIGSLNLSAFTNTKNDLSSSTLTSLKEIKPSDLKHVDIQTNVQLVVPILNYKTQHFSLPKSTISNCFQMLEVLLNEVVTKKRRTKGLMTIFMLTMELLFPNLQTNRLAEPSVISFSGLKEPNPDVFNLITSKLYSMRTEDISEMVAEADGVLEFYLEILKIATKSDLKTINSAIDFYFTNFISQNEIEGKINTEIYTNFKVKIIEEIQDKINPPSDQIGTKMFLQILFGVILKSCTDSLPHTVKRALIALTKVFAQKFFDSFLHQNSDTKNEKESQQNASQCDVQKENAKILTHMILYIWLYYNNNVESEWDELYKLMNKYYTIDGVIEGITDIFGHLVLCVAHQVFENPEDDKNMAPNALVPLVIEIPQRESIKDKMAIPVHFDVFYSKMKLPIPQNYLNAVSNKWTPEIIVDNFALLLKFYTTTKNENNVLQLTHVITVTSLLVLLQSWKTRRGVKGNDILNFKELYMEYFVEAIENEDLVISTLTRRAIFKLFCTFGASSYGYKLLVYLIDHCPDEALYTALEDISTIFSTMSPDSFILIPSILSAVLRLPDFPVLKSSNVQTGNYLSSFMFNTDVIQPTVNAPATISGLLSTLLSLAVYGEVALQLKNKEKINESDDFVVEVEPYNIIIEIIHCVKHLLSKTKSPVCHIMSLWCLTQCVCEVGSETAGGFEETRSEIENIVDFMIEEVNDADFEIVKNAQMCIDFIGNHSSELKKEVIEYIIQSICKKMYTVGSPERRGSLLQNILSFITGEKTFFERMSEKTVCECFRVVESYNKKGVANTFNTTSEITTTQNSDFLCDTFVSKIIKESVGHSPFFIESGEDVLVTPKNTVNFIYNERIWSVWSDEKGIHLIVRDILGKWGWTLKEMREREDFIGDEETIPKEAKIGVVLCRNNKVREKIDVEDNVLDKLVGEMESEEMDIFPSKKAVGFDTDEMKKEIEDIMKGFEILREGIQKSEERKDDIEKKCESNEKQENEILQKSGSVTDIVKAIVFLTNTNPNEIVPIQLICDTTSKFESWMNRLDRVQPRETHKIGIVYVARGQSTEEEVMSNCKGSDEYYKFTSQIGETIKLENWQRYSGGLDTKCGSDGPTSTYYSNQKYEIMFHEVVKIPVSKNEQSSYQQKKRHVGNDRVHIVFCENDSYNPGTITSQFNNAHIIVYPLNGMYRIEMFYKAGGGWGPLQNGMLVDGSKIGRLVRETAICLDKASILRFTTETNMNQFMTRNTTIRQIIDSTEDTKLDFLHLVDKIKSIVSN
ncbi:tuberin, putative [Entamoeba invadens IP1]|uniref:Tuberin, putative n=1 Tax=Entamoeba invadens IP1 TaxID=370355 RepID=A0A0A1UD30_ENTIV|nr:tuberin, putative [Entamoeba invadens IP1]ELP91655.1 tuberin, putative [Entamoeba invadens IP1]|eukprot:XP_004258426.1 tuberin, putative [Entamoeba invadens IP1]